MLHTRCPDQRGIALLKNSLSREQGRTVREQPQKKNVLSELDFKSTVKMLRVSFPNSGFILSPITFLHNLISCNMSLNEKNFVRVRSHSSLSWYMLAFNATTISIDFFASPTCGYITATGTDRRTCRTCCTVHPASRSGCLSPIADGEYVEQDQPHRSPTLLEDRNVFAADYTPKPAPSRTTPMEPLALNLSLGMVRHRNRRTSSAGVRQELGRPPAWGALFAEIKERAERPPSPSYVDCRVDRTLDTIFSQIFSTLIDHARVTRKNGGIISFYCGRSYSFQNLLCIL